jgi:hypothetical protein
MKSDLSNLRFRDEDDFLSNQNENMHITHPPSHVVLVNDTYDTQTVYSEEGPYRW